MSLFANLAQLAEDLAAEPSRLQKRAAIAAAIAAAAAVNIADAGRFCLYLAGQPFAEADPRKLNAGSALLSRALKNVSGCSETELTAAYRRHGDLGAAAFDLLRPPYGRSPAEASLMLEEIADAFAVLAGARSTAARSAAVEGLLLRATALEAKYLLKLMLGDMRTGVKQSLIEEAIAAAASTPEAPVEPAQVRHAVMLEADLGRVVVRAFEGTLGEARMQLFHPLGFMLASPVETPEEAIERFTEKPRKVEKLKGARTSRRKKAVDDADGSEDFSDLAAAESPVPTIAIANAAQPIQAFLEDKYDGMRAQIHAGDPTQPGRVAIYSRNREDITASFPELAEAFREVSEPMILDGEILGWDLDTGKALPFAVLGQRIGRKRVDNDLRRQIPVIFMAFDLLFEGGELLLSLPLRERRERLEALADRLRAVAVAPIEADPRDEALNAAQAALFPSDAAAAPGVSRFRLSAATLVASAEAIDRAYADARARANEGVMLKAASSAYLPGRRGMAWAKLKRELATLDVVITGAEFGHGRRAGLLSDYTFAVRGPGEPARLLNVGKAYSGVTDAEIAELTEWLKAHTLEDHGHFRTVEPLRVLEVAFNNVMRSSRHSSGFALRFPRILRVRDDKPVAEIDTLERVEEIYLSQPDRPSEGEDGSP